jgi:hypothetical protein
MDARAAADAVKSRRVKSDKADAYALADAADMAMPSAKIPAAEHDRHQRGVDGDQPAFEAHG